MNGKERRLSRISKEGKFLLVPFDHGMTLGPIHGIEDVNQIIPLIDKGGATGFIGHKGTIKACKDIPKCGTLLHLSANTKYSLFPNYKSLVATVTEGLRYGVDGISVHINLGGNPREADMIEDLGQISRECEQWQIPLLVMVYPRGKNISDPPIDEDFSNVARMAAELGADIIKTGYTGTTESFRKVIEGCPVPVLIAGGMKIDDPKDLFTTISDAMKAAAGISLGRNIFQYVHPEKITQAIHQIIFHNITVEQALSLIN